MSLTLLCLRCQGSGLRDGQATEKPGALQPLCHSCRGSGLATEVPDHYRAVFLVGSRFIVRMTIPRQVGGFVPMDIDWSPYMPPEKGPGKLRPTERRDYECGRDAAMREHHVTHGGREFSLIPAGARH